MCEKALNDKRHDPRLIKCKIAGLFDQSHLSPSLPGYSPPLLLFLSGHTMKTVGALLYLVGPLLLAQIHPITAFDCFDDDDPKWYLRAAVQAYATNNSADTEVAKKFGVRMSDVCFAHSVPCGCRHPQETKLNSSSSFFFYVQHPIGNWCVDNVTEFNSAFLGVSNFNEALTYWNTTKAKRYVSYCAMEQRLH